MGYRDKSRQNPNINIISSNVIEIDARAIPFDIFQSYLNDKMTQKKNFLSRVCRHCIPLLLLSVCVFFAALSACHLHFEMSASKSSPFFQTCIINQLSYRNRPEAVCWRDHRNSNEINTMKCGPTHFFSNEANEKKIYPMYTDTAYYMSTAQQLMTIFHFFHTFICRAVYTSHLPLS